MIIISDSLNFNLNKLIYKVIFSKIKGANHFFKDKEKELRAEIEKYIKDKTALI